MTAPVMFTCGPFTARMPYWSFVPEIVRPPLLEKLPSPEIVTAGSGLPAPITNPTHAATLATLRMPDALEAHFLTGKQDKIPALRFHLPSIFRPSPPHEPPLDDGKPG
jgi:hypothetical protein